MDFIKKLIPDSIKSLPCHMDFDGQRRAEKTFQIIIGLFAVVGFVWGYICQHFSQTIYILAAGFVLSCVVTLPPWPRYRRKPLPWQPARQFEDDASDPAGSAVVSKGKKKKQ